MNILKILFRKNNKPFVNTGMKLIKVTAFLLAILLSGISRTEQVNAAKILDEIVDYKITADVLADASVDLTYDIKWKVLDSDSEGPLEWVQIGIPNSSCNYILPLSDNITNIHSKNSSGNYAVIYFDRKYYAGEVVDFSFKINQGYMYQVYPEEKVAEYTFTPGWFDTAAVDNLEIRWNSDNAVKIEPASFNDNGYYLWQVSLSPGERFSVEIQYKDDAYAFDLSEHKKDDDDWNFSEHSALANIFFVILCIIFCVIFIALCFAPMLIPVAIVYAIYKGATGFSVSKEKKITRTIVEYYSSCPNCGGSREEGKEKCSYCGSNMVKSKQEIKEEEIKEPDKKILDFTSAGEYRYSDNPNKYVRVHVVSVPHVVRSAGSVSSNRSTTHHHSSCAHSSCACACACACAGGGRAGCSTKDFYNTDFKLKYLKQK